MKVLVTGFKGQVGYDVVRHLDILTIENRGVDIEDFDLTNEHETKNYIRVYNPDVVIHCAAYTSVDKAEEHREVCHKINVLGTRYVAQECREIGAKMVYISTDYVFDGKGDKPFEVYDKPNPINYYGQTKYEGELEVQKALKASFIIRTSWVFGINGSNFIKTILNLAKYKDEISVVSDQIGSPTYSYDLANLITQMIQTEKYGIYHATNEGYCSWYEFACEVFKVAGVNIKVNAIKSEDFPTKAKRPKNSRMSKVKLDAKNFSRLGSFNDALKKYILTGTMSRKGTS